MSNSMHLKTVAVVAMLCGMALANGCAVDKAANRSNIDSRKCCEESLQKWVGVHFSELVKEWGEPNQTFDNNSIPGGKILVWKHTISCTRKGPRVTLTDSQGSGSVYTIQDTIPGTFTQYSSFRTDLNGIIYNYDCLTK